MNFSEGKYEHPAAVLYTGCINWDICYVVFQLNKSLYGQAEYARLCCFVVSPVSRQYAMSKL